MVIYLLSSSYNIKGSPTLAENILPVLGYLLCNMRIDDYNKCLPICYLSDHFKCLMPQVTSQLYKRLSTFEPIVCSTIYGMDLWILSGVDLISILISFYLFYTNCSNDIELFISGNDLIICSCCMLHK